MKAPLNKTIYSPRAGRCVPPIRFAQNKRHMPINGDLPTLNDDSISEVFRRAHSLQTERNRLSDNTPTYRRKDTFTEIFGEPLHARFFTWAMHKLH